MSTFKTLLTNVGLAKLINAQALGTVVQWSAMAVGDGNGNPTTPTETQTALVRERYRASLNELSVDPLNPTYLISEMIIPATQGGWTVHEVGIYDADGDLVAVANCPATYKPLLAEGGTSDLGIRIIVQVSNASVVQLKIDPSIVLASRQWVINNYSLSKLIPGGTTSQVLAKKSNADGDTEWVDPDTAVDVIVSSREETQTLAAAQNIIDLAAITTYGCAVYIEGVRLLKTQFTINTATRLTLSTTYPAGSKATIVQNEETGSDDSLLKAQNLADLPDKDQARANLGVFLDSVRINIASAANINLTTGAPNTRHINITGPTTINGFTVVAGNCYFVRFNASLTLTNSAALVTNRGANIITAAGDSCIIRATSNNIVEIVGGSFLADAATGTRGQTYQNFTGSRSSGTLYTNATGRAIEVFVTIGASGSSETNSVEVDGVEVYGGDVGVGGQNEYLSFKVPAGMTYKVTVGPSIINRWVELR